MGIRDCADLKDDSQLAAVIFALLRATSLFRATLLLIQSGLMDASDVMRRTYWEPWMLGYEFRIKSAAQHAAQWHKQKNKHGNPDFQLVAQFEKDHGIADSEYGPRYGGLSQVAHPTRSAAENSIVTVNIVHGGDQAEARKAHDLITEQDLPAMLYLLIWTVVANAADLVPMGITLDAIPLCHKFFDRYQSEQPEAPAARTTSSR